MFHEALLVFALNHLARRSFVLIESLVDSLNFLDVPFDSFKIHILKLAILVEACTMHHITQNEIGNSLDVEILVVLEVENLIRIFVVHKDEDVRVAVSHYLLGFPEKPALSDIKYIVFILLGGCGSVLLRCFSSTTTFVLPVRH